MVLRLFNWIRFYLRCSNSFEHTIKLNGIMGFVSNVWDGGKTIKVIGWDNSHWKYKECDRVLLIKERGESTRYKIKQITRYGDPSDMYSLLLIYHPRKGNK